MSNNKDGWTKTTFSLPKSLLKEIKQYALEHHLTNTNILNEALKEYFGGRERWVRNILGG
jgi:hypothetical protein